MQIKIASGRDGPDKNGEVLSYKLKSFVGLKTHLPDGMPGP